MITGMNSFKNLAISLLSLIVALAVIGGAAYAYEKEAAKTHEADQLISSVQDQFRQKNAEERRQADLAQLRTSLQVASARLAELRATFSPVAAIDDAYTSFAKSTAALTAAAAKIKGPAAPKIAAAEQSLADILQAWKILLSSIPASGATASQIAQAENYAQQAQGYIDQIQTIANGLTPADSGLTRGQIDAYQQVADAAAGTAGKTSEDLAVALPPPPASTTGDSGTSSGTGSAPPIDTAGSSTGSPASDASQTGTTDASGQTGNQGGTGGSPTAADIAAQQQIVDQLQQQVDQLQQQASSTPQDAGTTAPPGTLDNTPPPIQYDIYGRPKLIQGSNSDVFH